MSLSFLDGGKEWNLWKIPQSIAHIKQNWTNQKQYKNNLLKLRKFNFTLQTTPSLIMDQTLYKS